MTKGKHGRSAALRDQRRAVDAVAAELAALAAEKERLSAAQASAVDLAGRAAELRRLEERLERITAKQAAAVDAEIVRLERDVAAVERAGARVYRA